MKYLAMQVVLHADEEYIELCCSANGQALRQVPPLDLSKNWYCKESKLPLRKKKKKEKTSCTLLGGLYIEITTLEKINLNRF